MGLRKVLILLIAALSTIVSLALAQETGDLRSNPYSGRERSGYTTLDQLNDAEQLIELKERLLQVETMLLAQKDRENELLRDLHQFVVTSQKEPEGPTQTQLDLEEAEKQFKAEAVELQAKITALETAMAASRDRDVQMSQDMNKTIIVTVSAVAGIGLLVFLVTVYLQYRLISRPVQPLYMQPAPMALEAAPVQLPVEDPEPSATGLVENNTVEKTNERFLSAIERLESRIMHMEEGLARADTVLNESQNGFSDVAEPGSVETAESNEDSVAVPAVAEAGSEREKDKIFEDPKDTSASESPVQSDEMDVAVLEEEGKRYLQKEDWESAYQHFDQLIRLDSKKVDNWVNRGRALEMLQREEGAIESYDQAIKINPDLPSPFLYKAALLSRMERFEEAQQFYNEALSKVPVQKSERVSATVER